MKVLLAPLSASHTQQKVVSGSNLWGLCALNNATSRIVLAASRLDEVADKLWVTAALHHDLGLTAPLLATRFREGKLMGASHGYDYSLIISCSHGCL